MLAGLTDRRCECCGRIENDDVAELLLVEALRDYELEMERIAIEREEKRQRDAQAWAEADRSRGASRKRYCEALDGAG